MTEAAAVTEVIDPASVDLVSSYADMLQVGTRSMQNFTLLQAVGSASKPVLLKRGMSATMEELLLSAEYMLAGGNFNVALFYEQMPPGYTVTYIEILRYTKCLS